MGKNKVKAYPLRIDENLMNKVRKIAEKEDRKISDQLTRIIKEYVIKYELQNGSLDETIGELYTPIGEYKILNGTIKDKRLHTTNVIDISPTIREEIDVQAFANKLLQKYENETLKKE